MRKPVTRRSNAVSRPQSARDLTRSWSRWLELGGLDADASDRHPALCWAQSGAMALTGDANAPPLLVAGSVASAAEAALALLRAQAGPAWSGPCDGGALLAERAACLGLRRRGRVSAGGSARLLRAAEGWLAVNLAREDDRAALPAWLELEARELCWRDVAFRLRERPAGEWLERARWLALPVAPVAPPECTSAPAVRILRRGPSTRARPASRSRVLDLSSLWAGPLCTSLLQFAGAQVVKLESLRRPDGARRGPARFFDLLNAGKRSAALDFAQPEARDALAQLVERADVVIEASRPRALEQMGIDAHAWVDARPGRAWISITGYGRDGAEGNWVAFGDDAAAAGGLAAAVHSSDGDPRFCADAVADPLAGLLAAVSGLGALRSGESRLLDVSLRAVAAAALADPGPLDARVLSDREGFSVQAGGERARVERPRARAPLGRARSLGADTREVLGEC